MPTPVNPNVELARELHEVIKAVREVASMMDADDEDGDLRRLLHRSAVVPLRKIRDSLKGGSVAVLVAVSLTGCADLAHIAKAIAGPCNPHSAEAIHPAVEVRDGGGQLRAWAWTAADGTECAVVP